MLNVQNENRLWKLPKKNDIMTKKKNNLKKKAYLGWDANLRSQPTLLGKDIESKRRTDILRTEQLTQCENLAIFFSF